MGTDMVLYFESGSCRLTAASAELLSRWLDYWKSIPGKTMVLISGATKTPRGGRLRRLHALMLQLATLGIRGHQVRLQEDWNRPGPMGSSDDLPSDAIVLHMPKADQA